MTKCAPAWRLLLSLFLIVCVTGCSQFKRGDVADEKDPHYLDAKRRLSGLDYAGAIESFERALQSNPDNAAAHLELGLIFDERADDAAAVYHYQKYLNLRTNAPNADLITLKINDSKRALATRHVPAIINRNVQEELERLIATNEMYLKRIQMLETELARGPRYITNVVTNYVTVNEEEQRSRSMTWPTRVVENRPPEQPEEEEPPPRKPAVENVAVSSSKPSGSRPNGTTRNGGSRSNGSRETEHASSKPKRSEPAASSRTRSHTVRPGETLAVLARKFGVSVSALRAANPGLGKGTRAGQTLKIPSK